MRRTLLAVLLLIPLPARLTWHPGWDFVYGADFRSPSAAIHGPKVMLINWGSGGEVTAPNFALWSPEGGWAIENEGVAPDVEVENWPAGLVAGRDPQLERAIEIVLEGLQKNPPARPQRPPYPIRVRRGQK